MGVFDRQAATALRLIAKYGEECTWEIHEAAGGTPAVPAYGTTTQKTVKIVFLPSKRESLATILSMFAGTEIPTGGLFALMGRVDFEPSLKDTISRSSSGENYGIIDDNGIEALRPNGEAAILYKLRLAR